VRSLTVLGPLNGKDDVDFTFDRFHESAGDDAGEGLMEVLTI